MSQAISAINERVGPLPTKAPQLSKNVLDLFSLKGKVASVTGSSKGIGFAVAEAYAQAGANVALWYNSSPVEDKVKYLEETYNVKVKAYKCNVGNSEEVEKTVDQIAQDFGTIDVFVANAGIAWSEGRSLEVKGYDAWQKIVDYDLSSVYYCAKAVGRIFQEKGSGSLILTASMSGHIVNVPQMQAPYNAAKAAVIHLGKSLAIEWAPFARVNTVSPGYIATDIGEFVLPDEKKKWWSLTPLGREGLPQELTGAYLYFASNASTYTTGADLVVDGGYTVP